MSLARKTAVICGVRGQDGTYLARLLITKGYEVWGTSRNHHGSLNNDLCKLKKTNSIRLLTMNPLSYSNVHEVLTHSQADEVYFLSSQSSVSLSFEKPREAIESITIGMLNILEASRKLKRPTRVYHAGTSECFGDVGKLRANELTPFSPISPYAIAKCAAFQLVDNYRKSYNLWACSGILFNHESPIRQEHYVTQKIIRTVDRIANGSRERLQLGRLDIARDWGWAPEYVEAMWRMLQQQEPEDYVIATGETHTLEEFVEYSFACRGLIWREHVDIRDELRRPNDLEISRADPGRAEIELGWRAKYGMKEVIRGMFAGHAEESG